mgnify:CR=1 FL=1
MGNFEEMTQRLDQKLDQGFHCVKLKIGAIRFEDELELVKRIRNRYSNREVELRVDANGAFDFEDALYRMELLAQYAIHSIEQPIRAGQWSFMAELCRNSPLPIALDEELIGVNDRDQKRQMLNIVSVKFQLLVPSHIIASIHLSPSRDSGANSVAQTLTLCVVRQIFGK